MLVAILSTAIQTSTTFPTSSQTKTRLARLHRPRLIECKPSAPVLLICSGGGWSEMEGEGVEGKEGANKAKVSLGLFSLTQKTRRRRES